MSGVHPSPRLRLLLRSPVLNDGTDATKGEFKIMRFKPLGPGINGR